MEIQRERINGNRHIQFAGGRIGGLEFVISMDFVRHNSKLEAELRCYTPTEQVGKLVANGTRTRRSRIKISGYVRVLLWGITYSYK